MDYTSRKARAATISAGIQTLMDLQERGASDLPAELRDIFDRQDLTNAAFGAISEVVEVADAAGWKPWRREEPLSDPQKLHLAEEVGDLLHFIAWMCRNLQSRHGLTSADFASGFMAAHEKNMARFQGKVPGREPPRPAELVAFSRPAVHTLRDSVDRTLAIVFDGDYAHPAEEAPDGSAVAYAEEDQLPADQP